MLAARYLFRVPFLGSVPLLYGAILIFIAANLTLGITFSSIAKNQLQAMQMIFFFFLPSILLSGFMFPFRDMPVGADDRRSAGADPFPPAGPWDIAQGARLLRSLAQCVAARRVMLAVIGLGLKFCKRTLD